jgi:spermidine/putrescine ABC transporter ATP-binding subunit
VRDPGPAVLRLEALTKRYGPVPAVDGVTLDVREGELVSLLGPSGCGKTTLLRMAGGFVRPDAGRVLLDGRDVTAEPPDRRPTVMVFQSYALFPHLTVADNVGYPLRVRRRPRDETAARVAELLRLVQLDGLGDRRPDQLSGGQQQRVALARALAARPRVLLLDEPLSNLDAHLRVLMREELKRLQRDLLLTMAYVTHDQEEAMAISDRVAVMRAGRLLQVGTPREIYERPATAFVARFVGSATFLAGQVTEAGPGGLAVLTELGRLAVAAGSAPVATGSRVSLVIRPEAVRLTPAGEPGSLVGRVAAVAYTGAVARYTVEAGTVRLAIDVADPGHAGPRSVGDPVTFRLPADPPVIPAAADDPAG